MQASAPPCCRVLGPALTPQSTWGGHHPSAASGTSPATKLSAAASRPVDCPAPAQLSVPTVTAGGPPTPSANPMFFPPLSAPAPQLSISSSGRARGRGGRNRQASGQEGYGSDWSVLGVFPPGPCLPLPISHLAVAAGIVGALLPAPRVPKEVLCKGALLPS